MTELLRDNLRLLSEEVSQVDLRDRVLAGSRRAVRRRRVVLATLALIGVVGAAMTMMFAVPSDRSLGPAGPTPRVTDPGPTAAGDYVFTTDQPAQAGFDGIPLTVPAWPGGGAGHTCAGDIVLSGGSYAFTSGPYRQVRLVKAVRHDAASVAALFYCPLAADGYQYQVVDYEATDGGNSYHVRGQVLASRPGGVEAMFDLAADGANLRIEVGDWSESLTVNQASFYSVHQWRTYGWTGAGFVQVGGPTAFTPNPNLYDLSATATGLDLAPSGGARWGMLSVTVSNSGPGSAPAATVTVSVPVSPSALQVRSGTCPGGSWTSTAATDRVVRTCEIGPLAAGASVLLVLNLALDLSVPSVDGSGLVAVVEAPSARRSIGDTDPGNQQANFSIRID